LIEVDFEKLFFAVRGSILKFQERPGKSRPTFKKTVRV
jgi:hypothetical protein